MSSADDDSSLPARRRLPPTELDQEVTRLYCAQSRKLQGFLRNLGCAESQLEDICQDAFLAVRLRMNQANIESLEAYLYRVARNRFHRLNGKREARDIPCENPVDQRLAASPAWDNLDRRHALQAVLGQLSDRQRQVLFLRFDVDLSERQTAEVLGIAQGTVKKTTSDAKRRVHELLQADPRTWEGDL